MVHCKLINGVKTLCLEKRVQGKKVYDPIIPQPSQSETIQLQRYYTSLKIDKTYKRRISYIVSGKGSERVFEYIGIHPGHAPHGNAKYVSKSEYIRTPAHVIAEIAAAVKYAPPKHAYMSAVEKHDDLESPTSIRQVRDIKRNQLKRETGTQGIPRGDVSDDISRLQSCIRDDDRFVRSIIYESNRVPFVILYLDQQIEDIKSLCCSGKTYLGLDKTYNLSSMHVTVYKQVIVRVDSSV